MLLVLRLLMLVWFVGGLALGIATLADTLFGYGNVEQRLQSLLPRIGVVLLWPLAVVTPRGRYLLWARWHRPPE